MGAQMIESAAAPLNFAALLELVQTEALSLLVSSLIVVGLITLIEQVILKPDVRGLLYKRFREVEASALAHCQVSVPQLLNGASMRVRSLSSVVLVVPGVNIAAWRSWWTWKRTFILIQVILGVSVLAVSAVAVIYSLMAMDEAMMIEQTEEQLPCPDELLTPPLLKAVAPLAIFVGGALANCKAFVRIPVL